MSRVPVSRKLLRSPALALAAGLGLGAAGMHLLAASGPPAPASTDAAVPAAPLPDEPSPTVALVAAVAEAGPEPEPEPIGSAAVSVELRGGAPGLPAPEAARALVRTLEERLEEEAAARRRLEAEVAAVRGAMADLGREVAEVADRLEERERRARRWRARPTVDQSVLVDAGYGAPEAAFLAERWGEQEMAELYLRDQARREGWMGTERYAEAMRDLRTGPGSMRSTIGDEEYDAFLFSTGQSNRLLVESVVDSSPAQRAGLQPGDVIKGYDGSRIFSWGDLRSAIAGSGSALPATLEIVRDGQPYEVEVPRGPLGVRLDADSVAPGGS